MKQFSARLCTPRVHLAIVPDKGDWESFCYQIGRGKEYC